jgi:hypothetical protein
MITADHHPHPPAAPPTEPTAHRASTPRARPGIVDQTNPARLLLNEYGDKTCPRAFYRGSTLPRTPTCMVCHPAAGAKRCFFGHDSPEAFSSGFYLKSRLMISHDSREASSTTKYCVIISHALLLLVYDTKLPLPAAACVRHLK